MVPGNVKPISSLLFASHGDGSLIQQMPHSPMPLRSGSPCYNCCPRLDHPDVGQTGWNVLERLNSKCGLQGWFQPVTQILTEHTATRSSTACDWLAIKDQRVKIRELSLKERPSQKKRGGEGGRNMTREPEGQLRGVDEKTQPWTFIPKPQRLNASALRFPSSVSCPSASFKTRSLGARDQLKIIKILQIWRQSLGWGPRLVGRLGEGSGKWRKSRTLASSLVPLGRERRFEGDKAR